MKASPKAVEREIEKLNKQQCLAALGAIFNESGLRNMLSYYTVGSMSDDGSEEETRECQDYLKAIAFARKT